MIDMRRAFESWLDREGLAAINAPFTPTEFGTGDVRAAWLGYRAGQQGEARPAREERERLFDGLLLKFQTAVANVARAHQEYLGKAMADDVYDRFATARDETIPALRHELRALATQAAPEAQAEPAGEPVGTVELIAGMVMLAVDPDKTVTDGQPLYDHAAASGGRDTLRALLREARGPLSERDLYEELVARIDAALADGGAK